MEIGPTLTSWMWNWGLNHWSPWGPAVTAAAVEGEPQAKEAIARAEFVIHGSQRLKPKVHAESPYEGPRPDAAKSEEERSSAVATGIEPVDHTVEKLGLVTSLLWLFCVLYLLVLLITLLALFLQHRAIVREVRLKQHVDEEVYDTNFFHYCSYRFTQWFAWSENAKSIVLASLAFFFVMLGGVVYFIATGSSLGKGVFVIFCQLVEPDGGKTESTFEGRAVAGTISVGGLIIFAVLIAFTQDRFNAFLEQLRDGTEPVIEAGHIVIIGWTDQSLPLIKELCEAHRERGGCKIAVLSDIERMKIEEQVNRAGDFGGSSIIIRSGRVHNSCALKLVGAHTCKTAIIMSDVRRPLDARDAVALRVLLTLKSSIPFTGRILIHCARAKNVPLFEKLGGANTTVVTVEDFVGRIVVQCSRDVGISTVIKHTLGFGGAEFYILPAAPCVQDLHFCEALGCFPKAVLAGVVTEGSGSTTDEFGGSSRPKRKFRWYKECMEMGHVLQDTDEVVLFADNDSDCRAEETGLQLTKRHPIEPQQAEPDSDGELPMIQHVTSFGRRISFCQHSKKKTGGMIQLPVSTSAEIVLILGWNEAIWHMIAELDSTVAHGSRVLILSQVPAKDREAFLAKQEKYYNRPLKNFVACDVVQEGFDDSDAAQITGGVFMGTGMLGSRYRLENFIREHAMPLDMVSRIFIISDQDPDGHASRDPDSGVITTVLHLREIFQDFDHSFTSPRHLGATPTHAHTMTTRVKQNIHEIPIIAEVREVETEEHCKHAHVLDFVDSVMMSAQVLSMVAYEPRLSAILHELISETGTMRFAIRDILEYLDVDDEPAQDVSFFDAMQLGLAKGELVLGWSARADDGEDRHSSEGGQRPTLNHAVSGLPEHFSQSQGVSLSEQLQWEMNPSNKSTPRPWRHGPTGDRLAVLCMRHGA